MAVHFVQESYSHIFRQCSAPIYEWYDTLDGKHGLITSSGHAQVIQ